MNIVIDTNILIASILKDSIVRKILLSENISFFIPEHGLGEINKYKDEIIAKAELSSEDFEILLAILLENVEILPQDIIQPKMDEAKKIMGFIDSKDTPFIAAALALFAEGIWTFDNDFNRQKEVKIFSTKELAGIV